jgi:hypothetical protein
VAEKGYKVDARAATGGVTLDGLSGSEAQLRAVLAEATCNDGLRLTQQAGDIDATYQQEYIKAHEAELIAIKRNADERVAKAREILREVGLL